jgi:quercetin dioxygenase-like cupin family protein
MNNPNLFPDIITSLPVADLAVQGCNAHLLQGQKMQVLFMEFHENTEVPEHDHEAQWGVVLDGEIELTIDEEKHVFKKGDSYYIPKGIRHSAKIKKGYSDVTVFNEEDRYSVRK